MRGLLTGPLCGWPADKLHVFANERAPGNLPDVLVETFATVTDVALFYYVGHGQPDQDDRLCLGLVDSRSAPERRYTTSLTFDAVRYAMRTSRARFKVILLDCCYSGLAIDGQGTLDAGDFSDRIRGSGAYVIAACGAYETAGYEGRAGNAEASTYFTKRLVEIVEEGGGLGVLTLGQLADLLTEDMAASRRPCRPCCQGIQASSLPFAWYAGPRPPDNADRPRTHRRANHHTAGRGGGHGLPRCSRTCLIRRCPLRRPRAIPTFPSRCWSDPIPRTRRCHWSGSAPAWPRPTRAGAARIRRR